MRAETDAAQFGMMVHRFAPVAAAALVGVLVLVSSCHAAPPSTLGLPVDAGMVTIEAHSAHDQHDPFIVVSIARALAEAGLGRHEEDAQSKHVVGPHAKCCWSASSLGRS